MSTGSSTFVAPLPPRFRVEDGRAGGLRIIFPARRNLFAMLFLPVWLCGWTFAGFHASVDLMTKDFSPFLLVWLCAWAAGEAMALSWLIWMAMGREIVAVEGGNLTVSAEIPIYARRRRYEGAAIRELRSSPVGLSKWERQQPDFPLFRDATSGPVSFTYGARTIYAAASLDEAEGRRIVEILKRHLPKTATAPA